MLPLAVGGAHATEPSDGFNASWSSAGNMNVPRYHHTSTTLAGGTDCPADLARPAHCGKVLSVGGTSTHKATPSGVPQVKDPASVAELYDPANQKWTIVPGPAIRRPAGHTATRMPNGQVMVIGGVELNGAPPGAAHTPAALIPEIYTPSVPDSPGSWSKAEPMNVARGWHTATLLSNGKVLVLGGVTPVPSGPVQSSESLQSRVPTASAELYDPANGGSWTQLPGSLGRARYGHTATLVKEEDGREKVLVTGGLTWLCTLICSATATASAELIDPSTGISEQIDQPTSNTPRRGHTASLLSDGKVLVVGGTHGQDPLSLSADIYNPETKEWCSQADVPPPAMEHFFSSSVLVRLNTVLLAGLGSKVEYFTHEPETCRGAWTILDPPATPRNAHTANLLADGKMLLAGGSTKRTDFSSGADAIGPAELLSLESMPALAIQDVSVKEGNAGSSVKASFKVSLSESSENSVSVGYYTEDGNARSGIIAAGGPDYIDVSSSQPGILTFRPGELSKRVTVNVVSDNLAEPDENFHVKLVSPGNAVIADGNGEAVIVNDDNPLAIYATVEGPSPVREGNSGQAAFARFSIKLSSTPSQTVTLTYATEDGTAKSSSDYEGLPKTVLTFPAGDNYKVNQSVDVKINGDNSTESPETFSLNLSSPTGAVIIARRQAMAVIEDDDSSAPLVNISDYVKVDPWAGLRDGAEGGVANGARIARSMNFTISLSRQSTQDVTVKWSTADGTAVSDDIATSPQEPPVMEKDYEKVPPTSVTIPAGSTSVDVHVIVYGDLTFELNEVFFVRLSEPSGAILGKAQGHGLIANDDNPNVECIYRPVEFCV